MGCRKGVGMEGCLGARSTYDDACVPALHQCVVVFLCGSDGSVDGLEVWVRCCGSGRSCLGRVVAYADGDLLEFGGWDGEL